MYFLGERSKRNLIGVHPDLVRFVEELIRVAPVDFCILDGGGLRTLDQAKDNAARGTGVVTSRHLTGDAVDLVLWIDGAPSWAEEHHHLYKKLMEKAFEVADSLGVLLQWGGDWDLDGRTEKGEWDFPHYQRPRYFREQAAREAQKRRLSLAAMACE